VSDASDPAERREEELISIVPRDPRRPYKMRRILEHVLDRRSVFELGAAFGRPTITCLARLGGRPVGVLASDPEHYGGGVTADAADKMARFVDTCDQFHLPVVNFVDVPGFVIGTAAERSGTIRRGARGLYSVVQATVPWVSILVRKVYGVAAQVTATARGSTCASPGRPATGARCRWPGGLRPPTGAELEAAEDPVAVRAEIAARLEAVTSPFRTAERFSVEEIIDPRDTRPILCDWAERAHELVRHELHEGPKTRGVRP
jgi:acetyl-CoA carboxylase carboxyltransferase component